MSGERMTQERIRIIIADDHRLFTDGLRLILEHDELMDVIGAAKSGREAISMVTELKPDILLLDIGMQKLDGFNTLPMIRKKSPDTKALILTASCVEEDMLEALKEGAKGYLTKNAGRSSLIKAIKAVCAGEMWLDRKLMSRFFEKEICRKLNGKDELCTTLKKVLSAREQEVIRHLAKGRSNKEIAEALFISEKTVKTHLSNIFKKLNVTCRLQAILYAQKTGMF